MPRFTNSRENPEQFHPTPDTDKVRATILAAITAACGNITPVSLQRQIREAFGYDQRKIRGALGELVAEGKLNYIEKAGRTFIEMAFNRPVRVSGRILLVPEGHLLQDAEDKVPLVIQQGAAFGDGRHPSTRLALRGIEWVVENLFCFLRKPAATVLDIGTGSGVLLVAALRLGFGSGIGLDIDPCAVSEAAANIRLNGLAARAAVSSHEIEKLDRRYDLICANLRWPTLKSMRNQIQRRFQPGGALVVSGIRPAEVKSLTGWYAKAGFQCRWQSVREDWAALVLQPADRPLAEIKKPGSD